MENYIRSLYIKHIQHHLTCGCKRNVIPTKGFAVRCGWHCCFTPYAPHLSMRLANGEQRVWVECEIEDWDTYNRPESQGGSWILAQKMKIIRELTEIEVMNILRNVA